MLITSIQIIETFQYKKHVFSVNLNKMFIKPECNICKDFNQQIFKNKTVALFLI